MRSLTPGVTYPVPFSTSTEPDELPTATVYAGATSLGAATVTAASGTNEYSVSVALPSEGLTNGTPIYVKINWAVGGEAQSTVTLLAGIVNLHAVQAAAVLAAAVDSPIRADLRKVNGADATPATGIATEAKQDQTLSAIEALGEEGSGPPTGPGGIPVVIPVTSLGQPVDGAAVWITTDPEGTNQIAGVLYTDSFGNTPAFTLEAGIFYVWVQKAGVNFPNPQALQVLESGTYQWYTG